MESRPLWTWLSKTRFLWGQIWNRIHHPPRFIFATHPPTIFYYSSQWRVVCVSVCAITHHCISLISLLIFSLTPVINIVGSSSTRAIPHLKAPQLCKYTNTMSFGNQFDNRVNNRWNFDGGNHADYVARFIELSITQSFLQYEVSWECPSVPSFLIAWTTITNAARPIRST